MILPADVNFNGTWQSAKRLLKRSESCQLRRQNNLMWERLHKADNKRRFYCLCPMQNQRELNPQFCSHSPDFTWNMKPCCCVGLDCCVIFGAMPMLIPISGSKKIPISDISAHTYIISVMWSLDSCDEDMWWRQKISHFNKHCYQTSVHWTVNASLVILKKWNALCWTN